MTQLNPVLRRELVERWRGRRAFMTLTIYTALLAMIMQLLWVIGKRVVDDRFAFGFFDQGQVSVGPQMGRYLFENLVGFVLLLVLFIAPGYAAAQIAGERERKTLHLLQVTLVGPWQIAFGKLAAAVAWLVLLTIAAIPFGAATFFLGGVTIPDLIRAIVMILIVGISVAAMSLGVSSMTRKTSTAVVVTYGLVGLLLLGTTFAAGAEAAFRRFDFDRDVRPVALYMNPYYGLADAARADITLSFTNNTPLVSILTPPAAALPNPRWDGGGFDDSDRQPVWVITALFYIVVGVLGFVVAARRVRPEIAAIGASRRRRKDPPTEPQERAALAAAAAARVAMAPPPTAPPPPPPPPPDA